MPKVKKNQKNLAKCNCPGCPSYNACCRKRDEKLFCAGEVGRSRCNLSMLGCLCGDCLIHEERKLQCGYYCMHGSADYVDELNKMI